jgi:hypothetical protein
MAKAKVPIFGQPLRCLIIDTSATDGATYGVNLYDSDGHTLLTWEGIAKKIGAVPSTGSSGVNSTDDVSEGQWNLYFTDRRAQDAVHAIIANGNSITWSYAPGVSLTADTVQDIRTTATPSFAQLALAADPTTALQAATKQYVDGIANGLAWKAPCLIATTTNDTLSGLAARDGVTPVSGSRVLVMSQTSPAQNGIYVAAAGAWARSTDMDAWAEVPNASVFVQEGTTNADKGFTCTADPGGTLGVTAIPFVQFNGGGSGGVVSFNGRTGAVVPTSGDYVFTQIGGTLADSQLPSTRHTATVTSPSGAVTTGTVAMAQIGRLLRLASNAPLRVRLYSTVAYQTADQSRPVSVYPPAGSGLLFEGVTSVGLPSFDTGPVPEFFNAETTITNAIAYCLEPSTAVSTTATFTYAVISP